MREHSQILMWRFKSPINQTENMTVEVLFEGTQHWSAYRPEQDPDESSRQLAEARVPQDETSYVGQAVLV